MLFGNSAVVRGRIRCLLRGWGAGRTLTIFDSHLILEAVLADCVLGAGCSVTEGLDPAIDGVLFPSLHSLTCKAATCFLVSSILL